MLNSLSVRIFFKSILGVMASGLFLSVAQANEVPVFKMQCHELFYTSEEIRLKYDEKINVRSGSGPAFAIPSKNSLNVHSSFNWLVRRLNHDKPFNLELMKKGVRVRNAATGGQVGLGVLEQTWSFLHEAIVPFSHSLFEANLEKFTAEEKQLVQRIFAVMYMKQDLKFVSEEMKPGFFDQAGPHRIAVTGSTPGSTIYVNEQQTKLFEVSASKDKFSVNVDLGAPAVSGLAADSKDVNKILSATKKEQMANILGLLIHEFGHHAGMKDTADRPLDQIAAKFEKLALEATQEIDFSLINQPWIRMRTFAPQTPSASAAEGKILFAEVADLYDLTPEIKVRLSEKLSKSITKVWAYNLRIEGPGRFDNSEFATPVAVMADVVALDSTGAMTTVPVRFVAYIGPAQAVRYVQVRENWWQYANGQLRKTGEEALLSFEVLTDRQQSGVSLRPNPKFDIAKAGFAKAEYRAGETAEFNIEVPPIENLDFKTLSVDLTSDQFVQSGSIKKSLFSLAPVRMITLANGVTVATFQWTVPGNIHRSLKMKVNRITAKAKDQAVTFRVATPMTFSVPGGNSKSKLLSYGNGGKRVEGNIRVFPQPWLGFITRPGTAMPLEYRFESGAPLSLKLTGTVTLNDGNDSQNSGFVIDLLAKENHPLIESKEIQRKGSEVTVRVMLRAPKTYNNQPVEHIMLKSVYLLDEKLDEVFENAVIGIKPE